MKILKKIAIFLLGVWEFRRSWAWADPARTEDDFYTELDEAYDWGREAAHRFTFRHWDR